MRQRPTHHARPYEQVECPITLLWFYPLGANNWIVHMEGGGWCTSESDCLARAGSTLGSSSQWPPTLSANIVPKPKAFPTPAPLPPPSSTPPNSWTVGVDKGLVCFIEIIIFCFFESPLRNQLCCSLGGLLSDDPAQNPNFYDWYELLVVVCCECGLWV